MLCKIILINNINVSNARLFQDVFKSAFAVHCAHFMHCMCVCIVLQRGGRCTIGSLYCMSGSGCDTRRIQGLLSLTSQGCRGYI